MIDRRAGLRGVFVGVAAVLLLAGGGSGPAGAGPAADEERLGREVVPTFEAIRLTLDASKPDYAGSARIELHVARPTRVVRFHARDLRIESLALSGAAGPVEAAPERGERGLVTVTTAAPLAPGAYTLDIEFANAYNTQAISLYRLQAGGLWYTFTQFEAVDARGAFPCWDEPEFKIPFQLTLVVPEGDGAVSNTPIEKETVAGGLKTVVFRKTPPLPSYLLAIATGPLESVPIPGMSAPGRVITAKGSAHLAAEAARTTPPLVKALESYFGTPYPYEKLDLLALPEFWPGAMENAGAITFADRLLLIDPQAASPAQRRSLVAVNAHELAHMWFGDLVTMTWWDDLWLNESFASWMGDKICDRTFPEFRLGAAQVDSMQSALTTDARLSTRAVRQPVTAEVNLDQLADELAYDKGQAVLGMFEQWLGPETFRKGVIDYLKAHRWGNATAADLWRSLSKAAGKDVGAAMSTFLDQPGVPIVRCEILAGGRVRLSQRRFLSSGGSAPSSALWQIPVTLKYPRGKTLRTRSILLKEASQTLSLGAVPPWVHPNAGERGYYRWEVPKEALTALAAGAAEVMDTRERLGFLGNLSALLDAGIVRGRDFMSTLGRFSDDPDPLVLGALLDSLEKIRETFFAAEDDESFARYVRSTLAPALARFGRARVEGEDPAVSSLRPAIIEWLGRYGKDVAILDYADGLARAFRDDPASIDPSLAGVALTLSARRGDRALFDDSTKRFEAARVPADRERYLAAIGSFTRPELIEAALEYALRGPLRPQEVLRIPRRIASDPARRDRVWEWTTRNYTTLMSRMPPLYAHSLAWFAGGCSPTLLDRARAFFSEPDHSPPGNDQELAKVADEVMDCVSLKTREEAAVTRFFDQWGGGR
jgi:alanyl aminopeptidase